ncbi:hypothetical protein LF65_05402 [Clostridium beijerinckii]|uniref:Uncharacterized protein n=1 Tax=Clostridium beijerinckii TaxID=1520 RepID=A0A0B5QM22_CLOBE|nr:hypothetical protein [Clostridium beijerinckii]AJH01921.1 hypothetical protein LF65_05402 [Clostridium beijerinckii]
MKENTLRKINSIKIEIVKGILSVKSSVSVIIYTKKGTINSLPTANEVDMFHKNINNRKREECHV